MARPDLTELDRVPRRRGDVITVELDGEAVLYDPIDGRMHKLNRVGCALWQCLDGTVSLRDLSMELAGQLPEAEAVAVRQQILAYVEDLAALHLLERSD